MGRPDFNAGSIPMNTDNKQFINQPVVINGKRLFITCVSTGPGHAVTFVENTSSLDVEYYGSIIENHHLFPDRVNVNFAEIISREKIVSRTWERGSGETFACGTGACACLCVSALLGKTDKRAVICQRGGDLQIEWNDNLFMTGPAAFVYEGDIDLSWL